MALEGRKCENCGGGLEYVRTRNLWVCPYCDSQFEVKDETTAPAETGKPGFSSSMFSIEVDLDRMMEASHFAECMNAIDFCLKNFGTAGEISEYISKKCTLKDDCAAKGVREEKFQLFLPKIKKEMDPGEEILLYCNKGIFSQGKDFYVVTNKRCFFVDKKHFKAVLHSDIGMLKPDASLGTVVWYVNRDYDMQIQTPGSSYKELGILIALIALLSFEQDPNREPLAII